MIRQIVFNPLNPVAAFAAAEWQRYTSALTGKKKGAGKSAARPSAGSQPLSLAVQGDCVFAHLPKAVGRLAQDIRHDGFAAGVFQGAVYVVARESRGVLYGAYDLLEREGGIVFAGPQAGEEYVPHLKTFAVRSPLAVCSPRMPIRLVAGHNGFGILNHRQVVNCVDWLAKRKFSGLGIGSLQCYQDHSAALDQELRQRGLRLEVGGHSANDLLPPAQYADSHPEFFAVDAAGRRSPNNLCYSNGAMRLEMARRLSAILSRHSAITDFDLYAPDGAPACQCEICRTRPPGYWTYETVAAVANQIRDTHPQVRLLYAAYDLYTQVPPGVRPLPENVVVVFCEYWDRTQNLPVCDYRQGRDALKDEAERRRFAEQKRPARNNRQIVYEMAGWGRVTRYPIVGSYYSDLVIRRVINTAAATIRKDLAFYEALGMLGFTDIMCYPVRWLASGLNLFALGVYAWGERPEPAELIRQFARGMFGAGAEAAIGEYYAVLDEIENQPSYLGFNPFDLLHRSPKEIAYFAGVVDALVAPTRSYFEERLARLRACVKALKGRPAVNRRNLSELRRMTAQLDYQWRLHWSYYLAFAYVERKDQQRGAVAIQEAAQALLAYERNKVLDKRFKIAFHPNWYKEVIPQLRRQLAEAGDRPPAALDLGVGAKG